MTCDQQIEASSTPAPEVPVEGATPKSTYGQILRSSALIGGSSVVNIAIGIVRTKAIALLLGPAGFGLMGLYNSIVSVSTSVAGMGLNSSGVRQIAEAVGSGDGPRISRTAVVLRRISLLLGVIGAGVLAGFSRAVATLTFGNPAHSGAVAGLSLAVLLSLVSNGQGALIQGMRRIGDLAKMGILGGVFGAVTSVALVAWLGEAGVVPSLVAVAAMSVLTSWWFSRKIQVKRVSLTAAQTRQEATALLRLGFAFMATGFLLIGAAYTVRIFVARKVGLEAAGLYQSAWAIAGLYVGFILQAMGADFYPRLTAVATDDHECNRLVNEQALISLLLAGPGVIATITFAPTVIGLFYSAKFLAAVGVLRWFCLGLILQVVAWPMGFIVVAKNKQATLIWTEVAAVSVQVGLAWVLIEKFGLEGAGMAFFGLYLWHSVLIFWIVRGLTNFRWSPANLRMGIVTLTLVGIAFLITQTLPAWWQVGLGILLTFVSACYSMRVVGSLVSLDRLPRPLRRACLFLERFQGWRLTL